MRGSSESVPTRLASLLPGAEYIGCCRCCSAAARRTPAVIVGWKTARLVLLAPRIPLRYALPGRVSKAHHQALSNHQGASAKEKQGESGSGSFHRSPATANVRQQKRSRRASGTSPSFRTRHTRLSGPGHRSLPSQNPRNRRCERSGRSPECRRPSLFLLHHQKAHSLFPQEKENGGFEAAGLPRRPRPDGKSF